MGRQRAQEDGGRCVERDREKLPKLPFGECKPEVCMAAPRSEGPQSTADVTIPALALNLPTRLLQLWGPQPAALHSVYLGPIHEANKAGASAPGPPPPHWEGL